MPQQYQRYVERDVCGVSSTPAVKSGGFVTVKRRYQGGRHTACPRFRTSPLAAGQVPRRDGRRERSRRGGIGANSLLGDLPFANSMSRLAFSPMLASRLGGSAIVGGGV
jgi:hypothetical protein